MLTNKMTLNDMIMFKPSDSDMMNLNLDEIIYLKIIIIGESIKNNHKDIRMLFAPSYLDELSNCFSQLNKTVFYDFQHTDKTITIFDLKAKENYSYCHSLLEEILTKHQLYGDISISFFTHDNHEYSLNCFNGVVDSSVVR